MRKIISKRGKQKQIPQPSPAPGLPTTGGQRIIIKDGKWIFPESADRGISPNDEEVLRRTTDIGVKHITHAQPEND